MKLSEILALLVLILLPLAFVLVLLLIWRSGRDPRRSEGRSVIPLPGVSQVATLATRAVQQMAQTRFIAQVGMIAHLAVSAIGFLERSSSRREAQHCSRSKATASRYRWSL